MSLKPIHELWCSMATWPDGLGFNEQCATRVFAVSAIRKGVNHCAKPCLMAQFGFGSHSNNHLSVCTFKGDKLDLFKYRGVWGIVEWHTKNWCFRYFEYLWKWHGPPGTAPIPLTALFVSLVRSSIFNKSIWSLTPNILGHLALNCTNVSRSSPVSTNCSVTKRLVTEKKDRTAGVKKDGRSVLWAGGSPICPLIASCPLSNCLQ